MSSQNHHLKNYNLNNYHLNIIVLAAGKSERFKGIKLLSNLNEKKASNHQPITLVEHVLKQLSQALIQLNINKSQLHVATGIYHNELSQLLGAQYSLHNCENAHLGLGHSIADSVKHILQNATNTTHIMIALADQVALSADDYVRLITQSTLALNKLVCATTDQELMPPAIFPQTYFDELIKLHGDKGAKALLNRNKANLTPVLLANAVIDIDTKSDLIEWQNKLK